MPTIRCQASTPWRCPRPGSLRTATHFAPYVGETVFVELAQPLEGRRRFKGPLVSAGAATIEVEVDGRRYALPLDGIRRAHLAPDV